VLKNGVADGVKPATYENYYRCIQKYVVPFFKNQDDCITELCVGQFVKSIYDNPTLSEPYKRKIISIFKTALKGITKNADDRASIVQQIRLPRAENPIVPVFSVGEQRLIENAALNADDKRALGILLCFYTGLRLGDVCALRWGDIDLETGTMSVLRTVSRVRDFRRPQDQSALLVGTPKSKKSIRMIPLPAFLQNVFREWKMGAENDNCYVLSGKNIPVEPRTYQKLYKRILTGAGVKHRKFHAIGIPLPEGLEWGRYQNAQRHPGAFQRVDHP
jgi:integrase